MARQEPCPICHIILCRAKVPLLHNRSTSSQPAFYAGEQAAGAIANACQACSCGTFHVAIAVADEIGFRPVNLVLRTGAVYHAGGGLAAGAGFAVCGELCLWVMRTVVERIEMRSDSGKFRVHPVVDGLYVFFRIVAAGCAGLVRHEDGKAALVIDVFYGCCRAGDPDEVLGAVEVVDVDVQGTVAVEEDGLSGDLIRQPAAATFPKGEGFTRRRHCQQGRLFICHTQNNRPD